MTYDDLGILILLPYTTPEFEANLWSAVIDQPRDWEETEKKYLAANQGIRESIMQWAIYNFSDGHWTEANLDFLRPYLKDYQVEASADELETPSADSLQTETNR
jgi:sulfur relay (sulfurtransferase) DsrC/TusE family protein